MHVHNCIVLQCTYQEGNFYQHIHQAFSNHQTTDATTQTL